MRLASATRAVPSERLAKEKWQIPLLWNESVGKANDPQLATDLARPRYGFGRSSDDARNVPVPTYSEAAQARKDKGSSHRCVNL